MYSPLIATVSKMMAEVNMLIYWVGHMHVHCIVYSALCIAVVISRASPTYWAGGGDARVVDDP